MTHTCTVVAFDSFYLGLRFLRTQAQSVWKRRDFVHGSGAPGCPGVPKHVAESRKLSGFEFRGHCASALFCRVEFEGLH